MCPHDHTATAPAYVNQRIDPLHMTPLWEVLGALLSPAPDPIQGFAPSRAAPELHYISC